jgi:hypothetical protein
LAGHEGSEVHTVAIRKARRVFVGSRHGGH